MGVEPLQPSLADEDHPGAPLDRGQPVGDHQDQGIVPGLFQLPPEGFLLLGVQGCRAVVEEQEGGFSRKGAAMASLCC